jgi:outer membrane protein assembly factor BamB
MNNRALYSWMAAALAFAALLSPCATLGQTPAWVYYAPGNILFSPVVSGDGTVYFATDDRNIRAVSASGDLLWGVDPGGLPSAGMALQDNQLYFPTSKGELDAYSVAGNLAWRIKANSDIRTKPAVAADGTVYFGTVSGFFYAVSPKGKVLWMKNLHDPILEDPAVAHSGQILVASTRYLFAIGKNGKTAWTRGLPALVTTPLALDQDDNVYYVDSKGDFWSIGPDGTKHWNSPQTANASASSPVILHETGGVPPALVYISSGTPPPPPSTYSVTGQVTLSGGGTGLSGVAITTSEANTTTDSSGNYTLAGLVNGAYTLTPSLSGYTFSPASLSVTIDGADVTGKNFTATTSTLAHQAETAILEDDTTTNQVYAYNAADGTAALGWNPPTDVGSTSAPALTADGYLVVPSAADNMVYVLDNRTGAKIQGETIDLTRLPGDMVLADTVEGPRLYFTTGPRMLACVPMSDGPDYKSPWNQLGAGPRRLSRRDDPPTVSITAPGGGAQVEGSVSISANVTDDFPDSLTVKFFVDDVLIAKLSTAPYTATWYSQAFNNGDHRVRVDAKDSAGNVTSDEIIVTSTNSPGSFLVYPDDPPLAFSWLATADSKFRVDLSATQDFGTILTSSKIPGRPWLKATTWKPGPARWKKILRAAQGVLDAETMVYWRVVNQDETVVASGSFQISRVQTCDSLSPADGSSASTSPPPDFSWDARHNSKYQVELSDTADFAAVRLTSKKQEKPWLRKPLWTPGAKAWRKLAQSYPGKTLYWRVVAQDRIGRQTTSDPSSLVISAQ